MKKNIDTLIAEQDSYDKDSQALIASLSFAKQEIGDINSMKQTAGWKLINNKIREELQIRIKNLIKDDLNVQTLLALLYVCDVKSLSKQLDEEINKLIPD